MPCRAPRAATDDPEPEVRQICALLLALKARMPALAHVASGFSILSALVAERAGLHFDLPHATVFGEKVAARAVEPGFESLLDYYYFLRYDAAGAPSSTR